MQWLHIQAMISAAAGFVAGLVHVFSGPDHLTAVAPIAAVQRQNGSWLAGAKWGAGHAAGVIVIGILLVSFRELLPMETISHWSERLVGVMLIAIGIWGGRLAFSNRLHVHEHQHDGESHVHIHCHKHPHENHQRQGHVHSHAAFGIGTLHGLAGSSHFFGVLPALAFPTRSAAIIYLLTYALGTVAGMTLFSSVAGWLGACVARNGVKTYRVAVFSCSSLAVAVGIWWCAGH